MVVPSPTQNGLYPKVGAGLAENNVANGLPPQTLGYLLNISLSSQKGPNKVDRG